MIQFARFDKCQRGTNEENGGKDGSLWRSITQIANGDVVIFFLNFIGCITMVSFLWNIFLILSTSSNSLNKSWEKNNFFRIFRWGQRWWYGKENVNERPTLQVLMRRKRYILLLFNSIRYCSLLQGSRFSPSNQLKTPFDVMVKSW